MQPRVGRYLQVGLCLAGAVLLVGLVVHQAEPRYQGRTTRSWLREHLVGDAGKASNALVALGPRALPAVMEATRRRDGPWLTTYHRWTARLPDKVRQRLPANIEDRHWNQAGIQALEILGTNAAPVLPEALRVVEGLEIPDWPLLARILPVIAPWEASKTVPVLRRILQSEPPGRPRSQAGAAVILPLALFGPAAREALPELLRLATSPNGHVRLEAYKVLGEIGPEASAAVPYLEQDLRRYEGVPSVVAAEALWRITGRAEPLMSALRRYLDNNDSFLTPPVRLETYTQLGTARARTLLEILDSIPVADPSDTRLGSCIVMLEDIGGHQVSFGRHPDLIYERFFPDDLPMEQVRAALNAAAAPLSRDVPP